MNEFWSGAGVIAGLSLLGFIFWTVIKIRRLENITLKAQETITDDNIKNGVGRLSSAELDALLDKDLGGGDS